MTATKEVLTSQVAACLKRHIQPGSRLTIGYSGGLDSSVLLRLLANLRKSAGFKLAAVHIHHGLSPQADAWAQHCAQVCRDLDVPLEIHRVEVRHAGEGLEAAARVARYRVFRQLDTDFLVLAHHRDDQAETVLLQLLRGASLKGLAAMPEVRPLTERLLLLRPFLATRRAEIMSWATECGIEPDIGWIEDESNTDVRLARNALRQEVIPKLTDRFPDAPRALAQAAGQFAEAALLLDALADVDGRDAISADGLALSALNALPEPRARNLLRRFLDQADVEIHQESLREALRQLLTARQDAQVRIDFGTFSLRRYRHWAVLERVQSAPESKSVLSWQGETCLDLGDVGSLLFQAATGEGVSLAPGKVSIRLRSGGERLRQGVGRPRRTLKNLLREAGVPAWQRAGLPLVYVDESLVWAAGIGADSDFLAKPSEPGWLISWQAGPNRAG
jgi:tRNA(Ile)-lysidine synthase